MNQTTLLQSILDAPDNDEMRLVYADWLMEQGDPRGEFIAIQIQLKQMPTNKKLIAAEKQLLKKYKSKWIQSFTVMENLQWVFEKGFIKNISLTANNLVHRCIDIFKIEPIESLRVNDSKQRHVETILANPGINRLRNLQIVGTLGESGLRLLGKLKNFSRLEKLDLSQASYATRYSPLLNLLNQKNMPQLTSLIISGNNIGDKGLKALVGSNLFEKLQYLNVESNRLSKKSLETLTEITVTSLRHLNMNGNRSLENTEFEKLLVSELFSSLLSLEFSDCGISHIFSTTCSLKKLENLNLSYNDLILTDGNVKNQCLKMPNLKTLRLDCCQLKDSDLVEFSKFKLPNLKALHLSVNWFDVKGAKALVKSVQLQSLKVLCADSRDRSDYMTKKAIDILKKRFEIIEDAEWHNRYSI